MSTVRQIFCLAFATFFAATGVRAQPDVLDAQAAIELVDADVRASFEAVLGKYDEEFRQRPFDVVSRIERCRFLDTFALNYEYLDWIDEVYELGDRCIEEVRSGFPAHPEIALLELERLYDDAALLEAGEKLLELRGQWWTQGQNARLHAMLAKAADRLGDEDAARYATRALELDERADVRLIVATELVENGDDSGALAVLTSPMDAQESGDGAWYYLTGKMRLLADLEAAGPVAATHAQLRQSDGYYDHVEAARALRDVGAVDLAREELARAVETQTYSSADEHEWFAFEYELGSAEQALTAYNALRDLGWAEDPLGVNRVVLFFRHPSLPFRLRDLLGFIGAAAALAASAVVVALLVLPVHYRGLALRVRTGATPSTDGWQLRHAWLAMFVLVMVSVVALYAVGPIDIAADAQTVWGTDANPSQIAEMAFAESLILVLLLLPLAAHARTRQPAMWATRWPIGKVLLMSMGVAFVLRIPTLLAWAIAPDTVLSLFQEDAVWQMILDVRDRFGVATAAWILVLVAPIAEEFIFRGVVLKAFSGHVGFRWANAAQAALFAFAHLDIINAFTLFVFGVIAGWMARKSGGLLAPMIMHGAFNLIVGLMALQA